MDVCCRYYAYIWTAGYHVAETAANMDKCPVRRWELWRHFADFFQGKLVKTADLDPSKNYVFSCHPHGICCYSVWMNFATEATGWSTKFAGEQQQQPGHHSINLTASLTWACCICIGMPSTRSLLLLHPACACSLPPRPHRIRAHPLYKRSYAYIITALATV